MKGVHCIHQLTGINAMRKDFKLNAEQMLFIKTESDKNESFDGQEAWRKVSVEMGFNHMTISGIDFDKFNAVTHDHN